MIVWSLVSLLAATSLIYAVPRRRKPYVALALTAAGALPLVWCALAAIVRPSLERSVECGSSRIFAGETFGVDALSALFVIIITVAVVSSMLYSIGYNRREEREPSRSAAEVSLHYSSMVAMYFAMVGVVTSSGGYSFLFMWELMTIASFLLLLYGARDKAVRKVSVNYLVIMHIGFIALLGAFTYVGHTSGSGLSNFTHFAHSFAMGGAGAVVLFSLVMLGFGLKIGLFPLHSWMPDTYSAAQPYVSAMMSGAVAKCGVYGIVRCVMFLPQGQMLGTMGVALLIVGIVTAMWGVIFTTIQNDVRRSLAYSSVENVGIIVLSLGIAVIGRSVGNPAMAVLGISGALLHSLNHSLFKQLLFFGAGNLRSECGTESLDKLGGVSKSMPVTSILFLVGSLAICALPPFNGFISEFLIYSGFFEGITSSSATLTSITGIISLSLVGGIAVIAFSKLYSVAFLGSPRSEVVAEAREVDKLRLAAMAIPLAGIVLIGLFPVTAFKFAMRCSNPFLGSDSLYLLSRPYIFDDRLHSLMMVLWSLVLLSVVLYWVKRRALAHRRVCSAPTWGCGFTAPNIKMQYTSESFVEGFESIVSPLTRDDVDTPHIPKREIFAQSHKLEFHHSDRVKRLFAVWWLELLKVLNRRVMRLRTAKINNYILYALVFLVLIFVLTLFNAI